MNDQTATSQTLAKRDLEHIQLSQAVTDGDGVKIARSISPGASQSSDPFLLFDEFASDDASDYIGGFPEHPHRGFETVTYMLEGSMKHRDHLGNEGLLSSGGVQWMTAGRGVLHSEMPQQDQGRLHGFQLWVNLPAAEKMCEPGYQEFLAKDIPLVKIEENSSARVIAGTFTWNGKTVQGPVQGITINPDYFDIVLSPGRTLDLPVNKSKRVLIYVYRGAIEIQGENETKTLSQQHIGFLGDGSLVQILSEEESGFLLLAGEPIGEPVVNWGPFVMNTREEIQQAIDDYRSGRLVS